MKENFYLRKYGYKEKLITTEPEKDLEMVIVIPCFREPDLLRTLESLQKTDKPDASIEVITVINEPGNADIEIRELNKKAYTEAINWSKKQSKRKFRYFTFHKILPKKDAGPGLARKIGMDEAVRRFTQAGEKVNQIIVNLDADSVVDKNYLSAIYQHFRKHTETPGSSIYFEHPLDKTGDEAVKKAIIKYELFLRYYINGLKYASLPYAFHTIGSCMAVRSQAYQKQGGMNKRKAGEDFYFLQKIMRLGNYTEINTTRVVPSERLSERTPFGTGKTLMKWIENSSQIKTFPPQTFQDLKILVASLPELYQRGPKAVINNYPDTLSEFLIDKDFNNAYESIIKNCSSFSTFSKGFYYWFDGLKAFQFLRYCKSFYPEVSLKKAAEWLAGTLNVNTDKINSEVEMLKAYRTYDRSKLD